MENERDLIAGTIEDLKESLSALRGRRDELDRDIQAKESRIATWERKLDVLDTDSSGAVERLRSPKGANLRAIANVLAARIEGVTAAQVRESTGLPWSSVQKTLTRHKEVFETINGLWRLKESAKAQWAGSAMLDVDGVSID